LIEKSFFQSMQLFSDGVFEAVQVVNGIKGSETTGYAGLRLDCMENAVISGSRQQTHRSIKLLFLCLTQKTGWF